MAARSWFPLAAFVATLAPLLVVLNASARAGPTRNAIPYRDPGDPLLWSVELGLGGSSGHSVCGAADTFDGWITLFPPDGSSA